MISTGELDASYVCLADATTAIDLDPKDTDSAQ